MSSRSSASGPARRVATLSDLRAQRALTLENGLAGARARSESVDGALKQLTSDVLTGGGDIALVAQGGYGRGELSPHSDIDLLFVVGGRDATTKGTLRSLLYPLYDAGLKVGHATVTPKDAIARAESDLLASTAILSMRLVGGSEELFGELEDRLARWIARRRKALARAIAVGIQERHERVERAGWVLAPDLKDDAGGLRDVHATGWLARLAEHGSAVDELEQEMSVLLAAREALHLELDRPVDRLRIDLQPRVAQRLGLGGGDGADEMMLAIHRAARAIEHGTALERAEILRAIDGGPRRSGRVETVAPGLRLEDGALRVLPEAASDAPTALRIVTAAATMRKPFDRRTHLTLQTAFARPSVWDERARAAFFELLMSSRPAAALELIDHAQGWDGLIPEWHDIRGRAQHDPYHRYTVDAHSFIAVEEIGRVIATDPLARSAADEAGDLKSLYLAALLHDIGKGSGGDHSVVGEARALRVAERIGASTEEVASLVRHHLLLADTATRRDIDDGSVVQAVAETVGEPRVLRLLYILTAADGRATGPEAWTPWKASLVGALYRKTLAALETGELPPRSDVAAKAAELETYEPALVGRTAEVLASVPPSYLESSVWDMADEVSLLLAPPKRGEVRTRLRAAAQPEQSVITISVTDRPGTLARSAGVFALHRAPVLTAQAFSTTTGLALQRFVTLISIDDPRWQQITNDLQAAYSGRLALEARLERKALDYRPSGEVSADVRILTDASPHSTVIEVRASDALGLLYAVTSAISHLDLDIHTAKVDTMGERVVDAFYVRTAWGTKLEDAQARELIEAIRHRVQRFFAGS